MEFTLLICNRIYFYFSEECDELIRRVAHQCAPKPRTALSLLRETEDIGPLLQQNIHNSNNPASETAGDVLNRMRNLPTGLPSLDQCLRGGLRVGTITEVIGQAGAGKYEMFCTVNIIDDTVQRPC